MHCNTARIRAISHLPARRSNGLRSWRPRAVLTHMHVPLDYETVLCETPDNVEPDDGLRFEVPLKFRR